MSEQTISIEGKSIIVKDLDSSISQANQMYHYGKDAVEEFAKNRTRYWKSILGELLVLELRKKYKNYDIYFEPSSVVAGYHTIENIKGVSCILKTHFTDGKEKMSIGVL